MGRIDAYTLNKVAGWILGTGLLVFGLNELAHTVYHAEAPEQPGMTVEIAEQTPAGETEPGEPPRAIAELLAGADAERGQAAARACQACHTFEEGGAHRVGPNLWDVVGRPVAEAEGFSYSDALQAKSGETWTYEMLNEFIRNPREYAPGTKMAYGGMKRDEQRADLLAYLRTLSEDPEPLPQPPAEDAAAEEPAAAEETSAAEEPAAGEETAAAQEPAAAEETAAAQETAAEGEAGEVQTQGIAALVAGVDPEQGQAAARVCQACHTFEEDGAHRVGPNLWGIVGRQIAHGEGYAYSDALQARSGETWTLEALNEFIHNPREFAPGTKMGYGGMRRDDQRIELLAYLHSLSDDPEPLPQQGQAPEDGAEAPGTDGETAEQQAAQEAPAGEEPAQPEPAEETAAEGEGQDIAELVAGMDPEGKQGQAAVRVCRTCHTFEEGGAHRVGPNLWNVVGRPIASAEGYSYSDALQGMSGQTWTLETLNEFLLNPRGFAPGTKMAFGGLKRDEQRLQLLAYLRSLGADQ